MEHAWAHGIDLLHGEEVEEILQPHPLSFLKYHIVAICLIFAVALHRLYSYLQAADLNALRFLDSMFNFVTGMQAQGAILLIMFWDSHRSLG